MTTKALIVSRTDRTFLIDMNPQCRLWKKQIHDGTLASGRSPSKAKKRPSLSSSRSQSALICGKETNKWIALSSNVQNHCLSCHRLAAQRSKAKNGLREHFVIGMRESVKEITFLKFELCRAYIYTSNFWCAGFSPMS